MNDSSNNVVNFPMPVQGDKLVEFLLSLLKRAEAEAGKEIVLGALVRVLVLYGASAGASEDDFIRRVMADWQWTQATNGMIFEFKDSERAKAFAAAVKERWGLDCRVFDDAKAAERAHLYPFEQKPPVVHVDRPHWFLDRHASQTEQDKAWAVECQIEELAEKTFGGEFVGT
jgi:hypothetical protein